MYSNESRTLIRAEDVWNDDLESPEIHSLAMRKIGRYTWQSALPTTPQGDRLLSWTPVRNVEWPLNSPMCGIASPGTYQTQLVPMVRESVQQSSVQQDDYQE